MNETVDIDTIRQFWKFMDSTGLITGAWTGMDYDDLMESEQEYVIEIYQHARQNQ